jgi:hypothetical protein
VRIARGNNADLNGDGMVFLGDVTHDGRLDENDLAAFFADTTP